jgi:hypothetical protein
VGAADSAKLGGAVTVSVIVVEPVKLPCVPFTVTVATPVGAVDRAVSVSLLGDPLVTTGELNAAATPNGSPETERVAFPVNPFSAVSEIELVPPAPLCAIETVLGDPASVKLAGGFTFTVSAMLVELIKLPCVPLMVTVAAPVVAVELAVRVRMLAEPLVTLVGLKAAVTPLGKPVAASEALPVKPFNGASETELVPTAPACVIVMLFGEVERLKLGGAFTVSVTVVKLVRLPCVPLIVMVAAAPVVAVEPAVSVNTLGDPLAALVGLKAAVTPLGKPVAASVALPVNPFSAVSEMELVPPDAP